MTEPTFRQMVEQRNAWKHLHDSVLAQAHRTADIYEREIDMLRGQVAEKQRIINTVVVEKEQEIERLKHERDDAIDAEKIALREIGAENERLKAVIAGMREVILETPKHD